MAQSYLEGPTVEDGDPWDLNENGQYSREFQRFEEQFVRTDGGDQPEERSEPTD